MNRRWIVKLIVLALLVALVPVVAVSAAGGPPDRRQPPAAPPAPSGEIGPDDDTPGSAIELECGDSYAGTIDYFGDVDYYYTELAGGDMIAGIINAARLGTGLDPTLTLYAPDETTVLQYIDDFDDFDPLIHHTAMSGDRYYWAVRGYADFSVGDYTIRIDQRIYVTAQADGKVDGIRYSRGDVLAYHFCSGVWEMFLDISDMSLNNVTDIAVVPPIRGVLMTLPRQDSRYFGSLSPHDVYVASIGQVGEDTIAGLWPMIDGSDVGLTTAGEALDGVMVKANGNVAVSINGAGNVPGVGPVANEDIIEFTATSLWDETAGTWAMAFDGSDEGLRGVNTLGIYMNDYWLDHYLVFDKPTTIFGETFGKTNVALCWPVTLGDDTFCQNWWEAFDAVDAGMPKKVRLSGVDLGTATDPFSVVTSAATHRPGK